MNESARSLKNSLVFLYRAALEGADPRRAVERSLSDPAVGRALAQAKGIGLFAAGKGARAMMEGARSIAWRRGLAVLPRGYPQARLRQTRVLIASHPLPDRSSVRAADAALAFFAAFGPEDLILCLISGGTSSLLAKPRPGLSLAAKRAAIRRLASSGASIVELNRLRSRLSAVKAGKLGRSTSARIVSLVLSDVPGDDAALVGSGPTVRGRRGDRTLVVASNRSGLLASAAAAGRSGLAAHVFRRRLAGEAFEEGRRFGRAALRLAPGQVLIAGGETTVTLSERPGKGGRNLEFALGAAEELRGTRDVAVLAAGSDGVDGNSRAAGAFASGATALRARSLGLDAERALALHDTEPFFRRLGDLLITGPTGTNVGDWAWAMRGHR
jgi:glycerate 2-kinase